MADPVNLAIKLVDALVSRIKDVKTNHDGCRLLGSLAEQTLGIMRKLYDRQFESSAKKALELVNDALKEADDAINACCNTNFITAMLYKQNLSLELKHAAQRLEHALSLVCLSSLEMTSETQSKLVDLSIQLRNAKFEARATQAHLIKDLKDALESTSSQVNKEREDIKNLVQQLVREQVSTHKDLQELLSMLKGDSKEARENKEKQTELEINEVIAAIVESLKNTNHMAKLTHNMKIALRCPITQDLMQDPVMIKESGKTYDRSSITEWFSRGHFEDPLTNLTLKSRELVSDHTVRTLLESLLGESRSSSIVATDSDSQAEVSITCLQPGLYEGHGKFTLGSDTILAFQLLILEPDGNVIGYTLYKEENIDDQKNSLEIGRGEWTTYTLKLVYEDKRFFFCGDCYCEICDEYSRLRWSGRVSKQGDREEKSGFSFLHSPPPKIRMIWPSPGMMQLEGVFVAPQSQIKYNSKLVLSLEVDSSVDGWMWFEVSSQEPKVIGKINGGSWKSNGSIRFNVVFPPKGVVPNSWTTPTNTIVTFEIEGKFEQKGDGFLSTFKARIVQKEGDIDLHKAGKPSTPLDDLTSLDYYDVRSITSCWRLLYRYALYTFQNTENHKSESHQCTFETKFGVNFGRMHHCLHTKGWNPLHVACRDNSIEMIKEYVVNSAIIEHQDDNGQTPLCIASKFNAINVVKELLANGASIECQDENGWTALHIASSMNVIDIVKELIANGANLECQDKYGQTPLYVASKNKCIDVFKELIAKGANVECQDNNGWTPLHIALANNHIDVVKELVASGANIECKNNDGWTPLYIASANNHIDAVKELIADGANTNYQSIDGWTSLHVASGNNAVDVVKELIAKGANIECQDNDGWTPLHIASANNHINVVKELVANVVNLECQSNDGWTPLYIASASNHIDIVKELVANGANTEYRSNDGWTSLHVASKNNGVDVVKELVTSGAKMECPSYHGWTPLFVASRNNVVDAVKELVANGADVECQDNDGLTPLYIASASNHIDIVKELVANGANTNYQSIDGWTSLHVASGNNAVDVVKELIAKGANIECQDNDGWTPLHAASWNNAFNVVEKLISLGANIECQDVLGKTPLHIASSQGQIDFVKILLEHGASKLIPNNQGETPFEVICSNQCLLPYDQSIIDELEDILKM